MTDAVRLRKLLYSLLFFFIAGLCEIGCGYLVWLWLREDMSWVLGAMGGFVLFLYGIVPALQPSYFHSYDILGTAIAIMGVVIVFYVPRKGEESLWQK